MEIDGSENNDCNIGISITKVAVLGILVRNAVNKFCKIVDSFC